MAVPKAWNGSAWVKNPFLRFKVWNGSAWVYARPKIWNGSVWYDFDAPTSDSQTVTVGYYGDKTGGSYGYSQAGAFGSISDGTCDLYAGAPYLALYSYTDFTNTYLYLTLSGSRANSGWSTLTIDGTPFSRTSASYSSSTNTTWTWTIAGSSMHPFSSGNVVMS